MTRSIQPLAECGGYHAGHPWYYLLGGAVPTPKQIRAQTLGRGYRGYLADTINHIDAKNEPKRSEELRALKLRIAEDLKKNLSRYREVARELQLQRRDDPISEGPCSFEGLHTAMSLKYSHLYNDFGHLIYLDELLAQQPDLFS